MAGTLSDHRRQIRTSEGRRASSRDPEPLSGIGRYGAQLDIGAIAIAIVSVTRFILCGRPPIRLRSLAAEAGTGVLYEQVTVEFGERRSDAESEPGIGRFPVDLRAGTGKRLNAIRPSQNPLSSSRGVEDHGLAGPASR